MAIPGITSDSIVGDQDTGLQAMFPRFTFDGNSKPSLSQVKLYSTNAINCVSRMIRFKGYSPADIVNPAVNPNADEDKQYIAHWIELMVAAEIHTTVDQFKDAHAANSRLQQLERMNTEFTNAPDPFPSCPRASTSETFQSYPDKLVRPLPHALL